jgi:hypothetical protein
VTRLLDPSFRYVPSSKVATEGVLARWLARTKEGREQRAREATGKVVAIKQANKGAGR